MPWGAGEMKWGNLLGIPVIDRIDSVSANNPMKQSKNFRSLAYLILLGLCVLARSAAAEDTAGWKAGVVLADDPGARYRRSGDGYGF